MLDILSDGATDMDTSTDSAVDVVTVVRTTAKLGHLVVSPLVKERTPPLKRPERRLDRKLLLAKEKDTVVVMDAVAVEDIVGVDVEDSEVNVPLEKRQKTPVLPVREEKGPVLRPLPAKVPLKAVEDAVVVDAVDVEALEEQVSLEDRGASADQVTLDHLVIQEPLVVHKPTLDPSDHLALLNSDPVDQNDLVQEKVDLIMEATTALMGIIVAHEDLTVTPSADPMAIRLDSSAAAVTATMHETMPAVSSRQLSTYSPRPSSTPCMSRSQAPSVKISA
jgi:hypothetical protein